MEKTTTKEPTVRPGLEQRLKQARKNRNITQQTVADAIGLSPQAVSALERKRTDTSFVQYLKYLRKKGVDLNTLFASEE